MRTLISLFAAIALARSAHAITFVCDEESSSEFKMESRFDFSTPRIESFFTTYNQDGSVKDSSVIAFLSQTIACDKAVDFARECTSQQGFSLEGFKYQFECKDRDLKGYAFIDREGYAEFACNGEKPWHFWNCRDQ